MEIHKFFTYVFSLYSATDAYPFCVCKNKAEEKEPHIEKRGAQLVSQTKIYLGKEVGKRTLPRRRLSRAVEAKTMLWGNWPPHPLFNRRYPTSIKGARASEATMHAHSMSASSTSKNAVLGTIVPSVPSAPCVPALSGTQKMYGFGFIASFAFVLRPPISAAAKASG